MYVVMTYDALNLTPTTTDETYSRLRTTQTKTEPSYELQNRADIEQSAQNGAKQNDSKDSSNTTKYNLVLIIMIAILLLFTLTSIAMSVATYNQQSKVQSQLNKINNDTMAALTRVATTQSNIKLELTQLATEHDAKLNSFISVQRQYSGLQTQTHCGPGLWHRFVYLNMSDLIHGCPFAWREYNTGGVRACGRPDNSPGSCLVVSYFIRRQYSRVRGRVIDYQFASTDGFKRHGNMT